MMLEKNNEKILKMLENTVYLTRQAKAAVDVLLKKNNLFLICFQVSVSILYTINLLILIVIRR